jgi:hypothetical protein
MEKGLLVPAAVGLVSGISLILAFSYAPALKHYILPVSNENRFGYDAMVVYAHEIPRSCIQSPCYPASGYVFMKTHKEPVLEFGYSICDIEMIKHGAGFSACITREEGGGYTTWNATGWMMMGTVGFEVGDTVNIRVKLGIPDMDKVGRVDITNDWSDEEANATWIDLGNSKVIEVETTSYFQGFKNKSSN